MDNCPSFTSVLSAIPDSAQPGNHWPRKVLVFLWWDDLSPVHDLVSRRQFKQLGGGLGKDKIRGCKCLPPESGIGTDRKQVDSPLRRIPKFPSPRHFAVVAEHAWIVVRAVPGPNGLHAADELLSQVLVDCRSDAVRQIPRRRSRLFVNNGSR